MGLVRIIYSEPNPDPDTLDDSENDFIYDLYRRPEKVARGQCRLQPDVDPNDIRMELSLEPLNEADIPDWLAGGPPHDDPEEPAGE